MRRVAAALLLVIGSLSVGKALAAARELQVATLRMAATAGGPAAPEAAAIGELNDALAREICQRLAARCIQQPMPFAEVIPGIEAGRFQLGIANVLRTPEREGRVLFSHALWRSSSRLVGSTRAIQRFGRNGSIDLARLQGASVAVERGTQQHRHLGNLAAAQKLRIIETASAGEALGALLAGEADFSLMPVRSAYFLLSQQPAGSIDFVGPPLVEDGLGGTVHVILPKSEVRLLREVDGALDAMRQDGTFQRILRRHMPFLAD